VLVGSGSLVAPLRDVRGVQALAAQQCASSLLVSRVVLVEDLILELDRERPSSGFRCRINSIIGIIHGPIVGAIKHRG
jgi:hypothetical protein